MKSARWYIEHQGRRLLAATKAQAAKLAQLVADETGLAVTVRPVPASRGSRISVRRSPVDRGKRNPAARPAKRRQSVGAYDERLAYFAGVTAARDGRSRTSNPHYGKEATAWRRGFDEARAAYEVAAARAAAYRPNPDPGSFIPVWDAMAKSKKGRLDFLAATKARRLAKGLRGRDRGGAVKAAERGAAKSAKFAVRAANRQESFELFRPSRRQAENLADQFKAAGYKVQILEV